MTVTQMNESVYGLCFNTQDTLMQHTGIRKAFIQTLDREALLPAPGRDLCGGGHYFPEMTLYGEHYREAAGSDLILTEDPNAVSAAASALRS